jgi:hypothetical protein
MKILIRSNKKDDWQPVESVDYGAEKELQKLLAETPSLITINEIRENSSSLVVAVREVGLPGSGHTDLLAFSATGDIAIVECKLASSVEIKRKVIAQVLEYGAYLWGMNYDRLNQLIYKQCNKNLTELVGEAAGDPNWDEETFRSNIEETLINGSFILIIAVDEINEELGRTIRFMNTCGSPAFAFTALEMHRYQKGETEILVPDLFDAIGQTKTQGGKGKKQWTEQRFFEVLEDIQPKNIIEIIRDLYNWTQNKADRIWFGTGAETGSFTFHYLRNGKTVSIFSVYTSGVLIVNYGWIYAHVDIHLIEEFHQNLTKINGFRNFPSEFNKWPSVKIAEVFLNKADILKSFEEAIEAFGEKVHALK